MPDHSPKRHPGWLLATDLSARCNRPLERARQLAAAFPFPLASALVFDTPRAAGGISHGTTGARCASPDNGTAASFFRPGRRVVDNDIDLAIRGLHEQSAPEWRLAGRRMRRPVVASCRRAGEQNEKT